MTEREMEEIFSLYGYAELFKKFKWQIVISGMLDEEESDFLESFFSWNSFGEGKSLSFEDFKLHVKIFKMIYERNILPALG